MVNFIFLKIHIFEGGGGGGWEGAQILAAGALMSLLSEKSAIFNS